MLKLRWRVKITNSETGQELDFFVPGLNPENARCAALRVAFAYLDWKKCRACRVEDVRHAGLPLNLSSDALNL